MALLPLLTLIAGESLLSYLTRMASSHAGMTLRRFLAFLDIALPDIVETAPETLTRLENLSGLPADRLLQSAILRAGSGRAQYGGLSFATSFLQPEKVTFCPLCLLENAQGDSGSNGHRVGLLHWNFRPFRTCALHGISLIRRTASLRDEQILLLEGGAHSKDELAVLAQSCEPRAPSPLQLYAGARLACKTSALWPDLQRIDQVATSSELLGACLMFGPSSQLKALTEHQRDAAGRIGFDLIARGKAGICEGLDQLFQNAQRQGSSLSPSAAFGNLYSLANRTPDEIGGLHGILRDFILEHMPIAAGEMLLGTVVPHRLRHTASSLAATSGLSRQRVTRLLVENGLLPAQNTVPHAHLSFEARAGEQLAQMLKDSLPAVEIPRHLNCNATTARMLIADGYAARIAAPIHNRQSATTLAQITHSSLDAFLNRLSAQVTMSPSEMQLPLSFEKAARDFHWPIGRIVKMVLNGRLKRIGRIPKETGFAAFRLDKEELEDQFYGPPMAACVSRQMAAQTLDVDLSAINLLFRTATPLGHPYVRRVTPLMGKGKYTWHIEATDFADFVSKHISLTALAKERNKSLDQLKVDLRLQSIAPVLTVMRFESSLFLRADL